MSDTASDTASAATQDPGGEAATLRRLARQMAKETSTPALLDVLARTAMRQARTRGAAVLHVGATTVHVECAIGGLAPLDGLAFPLEGSLTARAVRERVPVLATHYDDAAFPLAPVLRELGLTQVLCVPMLAGDAVLGVLLVARGREQPLFAVGEMEWLQVVADHASVVLSRTRLLDQAQAADRAKGRFLATISHELLTPLTTLTGYGELLADQVIGPMSEPQLEILGRMLSVTHDLSAMIEEILAFASLEEGRNAVVRVSDFLAADLVRSVAAAVEPQAAHRGLQLTWTAPAEPIRLSTDLEKARVVLTHLAANAVKFTDRGSVSISVTCVEGEVRFDVQDTGIGIAAEDIGRLFHPFTQLDQGLTRRHGGTGLGLHIAQRLAMLLGGRIEVRSTAGAGSTFTFRVRAYGVPLDPPG